MDEIESKIIRDFIDEAMDSGFECTPTFSMDECVMLLTVIVVGLLCSFIDTAITLMRSWFDKERQGRK